MKLFFSENNLKRYKLKNVVSNCPICSSKSAKQMWTATCSEQAAHFLSPIKNPNQYEELKNYINYLQGSSVVSINKCLDCEFTYSYPYVAGDKRFYDLIFSRSNNYPKARWEFAESISIINNEKLKNPKILEIGAGDGAFLEQILSKGITSKKNITAIEYSIFGKSKIEHLGIKCLAIDIRDSENILPHEEYDFICLFQVLEHLDDIHNLMDKLKKLLSRNGRVLIAVPNDKIIQFNELNGALLDMPPNHVGRWSKLSFERYCQINGMSLIKHAVEPYSLINSIYMMFSYRFLKKSQNKNSLEALVRYKLKGKLSWFLTRLFIIFDFLKSPNIVQKIFFQNSTLGGESQLVYISKKK